MPNPLYDALFAPLSLRTSPLMILADGVQITGAQFHTTIARAANALRAAGVQAGDRVAVQIAKSPEALALYAASVSIGAVFLPLNPAYTPPEVGYFLNDATPRLFICDPAKAEALGAVARQTMLKTLDAKGAGSFGGSVALYSFRCAAARFADLSHSRVVCRFKRQFADGGADDLPVGV